MSLRKLTILSLYTTLSLVIYLVESSLPPLVPLPGIKLGLANIIILILLRRYSFQDTLLVLLARILLASLFAGQAMALLYSLAGGFCSLCCMYLINRLLHQRFLFLGGITGGLTHNLAQLAVAMLLTKTPGILLYLPFLLLSGMITGLFTGLCASFSLKYLNRFC